jgi:outer membrane protein TolC
MVLSIGGIRGNAQSAGGPSQTGASQGNAPVSITLDDAIHRAEVNDPSYASAKADRSTAALDRWIARTGMLPNVTYSNQGLYTQPNGLFGQTAEGEKVQPLPKFIANNGVREYISQAVVNENLGLGQMATINRADAAAALAAAQLEVSRRGLVAAVTGLYYGVISADHKLTIAEDALAEAKDFTKLTSEREQAREAAHADVVKAQLTEQQRDRDLSDAQLGAEKSRLELAVLLFADPDTQYELSAPENIQPLASRADVDQAASKSNPELKSALAELRVNSADVLAARAGYLPTLGLNVTYGIDANQFAAKGPDGEHNLGYSALVTVDIPVWDWLATQHKVKQSEIRRDAAKVTLSATQKHLVAQLDENYSEAAAARDQLASLDASVAAAAESLRLTKLRYTGGEASVLEVVDAQNTYLTTQNAREDGRVRYEMALAALQTLTGTM